MDGRLGDLDLPPTTPLRPTQLGRGLPVPPVVTLAAVVCVFAGIAFGYGVAPKPSPLPSSSPTVATVSLVESPSPPEAPSPSVAPTAQPAPSALELPPAGGLTLAEALAAFNKDFMNIPGAALTIGPDIQESAVIYARVERYGDLPSLVTSPEQWVWAIDIRGSFQPVGCGDSQPTLQPCPGPFTTAMIVLNYNTGAFLATWSPAFP
jgi:hypothetical protein